MDLAYREYGGWASANIEVRVHGNQIFIGDRLPLQLASAEVTGLIVLAQHVLDVEDQFAVNQLGIADSAFQELEIQTGPDQVKRFVVRPGFDTPPPAFEALISELTAVWRADMRARLAR